MSVPALVAGRRRAEPRLRQPQAVVGPGERRIEADRRFVVSDRFPVVGCVQGQVSRHVLAVGLRRVGQRSREVELFDRRLHAQRFPDAARDRAGQGEQLVAAAGLVAHGCERLTARDVDQLGGQHHRFAPREDLAHEHDVRSGQSGGLAGHRGIERDAVAAAALPVRGEHLGGRDDPEPARLRHVGRHEAHQHPPQVAGIGRVGEVLETDHADRPLRRGRRLSGLSAAAQEDGPDQGGDDDERAGDDRRGPRHLATLRQRLVGHARHLDVAGLDLLAQALELVAHVEGRLVTPLGSLLETGRDHAAEVAGESVLQLGHRDGGVLEDGRHRRERRVARERPPARGHLVEHDAQREDVRALVDRLALGLLRGHVRDGADDASLGRHGRGGRRVVARQAGRLAQLGQAEVEHLDAAVVGDHHVVGLEVAVHDPLLVGRVNRVGQRDRDVEEPVELETLLADAPGRAFAVDQLHREEVDAVGLLDRVDRDDVRVVERRDGLRFALEPLQAITAPGQLRGQDLERHLPLELRVLGEVHLAHSACSELPENPVVRERLPRFQDGWAIRIHDTLPQRCSQEASTLGNFFAPAVSGDSTSVDSVSRKHRVERIRSL